MGFRSGKYRDGSNAESGGEPGPSPPYPPAASPGSSSLSPSDLLVQVNSVLDDLNAEMNAALKRAKDRLTKLRRPIPELLSEGTSVRVHQSTGLHVRLSKNPSIDPSAILGELGRPIASAPVGGERSTALSPAAQHILETFVSWGRHASAATLSILSQYSLTSSGFTGALSELKSEGLIEGSSASFALTALGKVRPSSRVVPRGEALLELTTKRFDPCAVEILRFMFRSYPDEPFTVKALAENTKKSTGESYSATSSGFTAAISKLRKQAIIADTRVQIRLSTEFLVAAGLT